MYIPQHTGRAYRLADPSIASAPPGTPIPFVLSTPGTKRDGLNLATLPFSLERYRQNPVVLFFHRYDQFSIGRGEVDVVETNAGQALYATSAFDVDDPVGAMSDRKYRSGFMFAVSMGWDDIDDHGVPVRASKRRAVARDLLEFSVVSVPADPDALIDMAPEDVARTRSFMAEARSLLPAGDARLDDIDEVLRRLAACEGAQCDVVLDQARSFLVPGYLATRSGDDNEGDARETPLASAEAIRQADGAADEGQDPEASRRAAMAAMFAAVWVDSANDADDDARARARKALIPEYRRLGLVPPAFLPASVVAALPLERRRALFVNGEADDLEEIDMTTTIRRPATAAQTEPGQRAGATLSKTTRSTIEGAVENLDAARKTLRGLLDQATGERGLDARSCGCGNGSSHTRPDAAGAQGDDGERADLAAELERLSQLFPDIDVRVAARGDGAGAGARQLVGIDSVTEAATEAEVMSAWRPAAELPADLKQMIADEVAAQIAADGVGDEPVAISLSAWLQDPDYPIEPGSKAVFAIDLSPEMTERIKAAVLGLEQPAAEEPPAEDEEPAAEDAPAETEEVPADGTASAPAPEPDVLDGFLDAATLALFAAAAA